MTSSTNKEILFIIFFTVLVLRLFVNIDCCFSTTPRVENTEMASSKVTYVQDMKSSGQSGMTYD